MGTPVICVDSLSKQFVIRKEKSLKERLVNFGRSQKHKEEFWALSAVTFEIDSGSTVGLVGPNGSGKSTLLKMVGGILQPNAGTVNVRGRIAALLELGAGFHPDLTGRENVYLNASILGISKEQTEKYFDAIVDFSGIEKFIDTQVKFYSSGMYVRLAFAVAVHVDPDILLVDEVLAVGDEPFQRKCMDRIRQFQHEGRTILFVSHSLGQVADLCDRAIVLEGGRIIADDEPMKSLRVLRSEFDHIRAGDLARQHAATSSIPVVAAAVPADGDAPAVAATPAVRPTVEEIELFDQSGAQVTTVRSGDSVTVAVTVRSDSTFVNPTVEIGIDTALGVSVFVTSTKSLGQKPAPLHGLTRIAFPLDDIHLGDGAYSLSAAVSREDGSEVDRLRDVSHFEVLNDGRASGLTWFPVRDAVVTPIKNAD
jgi:ABC-2 type transport system ATP-binding protein